MIKYIKVFVRNVTRQKSVSVLSVGSLSMGIAVALLIGLWVIEEFSFDNFHKNGQHIYGVMYETRDMEKKSGCFRHLGDDMKNSFPEVKDMCRIVYSKLEYNVNQVIFPDVATRQVEENFFTFFSFPLISGNAITCLDAPGKMVISESIAEKWFSGNNPIGQIVKAEGIDWQVTAVMKDIPYNSHIQADVVVHFYGRHNSLDCQGNSFITYVYAPEIPDMDILEQRFTQVSGATKQIIDELGYKYTLMPLKDIHFSGVYADNMGDKVMVVILAVTALAILLIACINFINLFIATSFLRVREIGVRKTFGAGKKNLILGFYMETLGYVLFATILAVIFAVLFLPLFNQLTDYQLKIGFDTPLLYCYLIGVVVFTFLVAGSYPAFYMARFGVIDTLDRQLRGKKLSFLQDSLLVLQFSVSITFLILICFVYKQVDYMINYDLGFNKENVVCIEARPELFRHYDAVRDELLKNPQITDITLKDVLPMNWADGYPVPKPGSEENILFEVCQVKNNYFDMLGIQFVDGDMFSDNQAGDYIVIDETAVKDLGLQKPVGAELVVWTQKRIVKGVVRSTINKTFRDVGACPIIYTPITDWGTNCYMMFKITGHPQEAIGAIRGIWEQYTPGIPFEYEFLDVAYQKLYESEIRLGDMFLCAMVIMFLLSISGLFAIAYYKMQRQIKEVGVRKINGAGICDLLILLNFGFIRLVLFSFIIGGGLSYYFASYWLKNFSVRTELSWWVFVGAGVIAVAVALLTVCYLTLRTARMNPVDALKSE